MAGRFGLIGPSSEAGIAVWTGLPGGGKSFQAAQLQVWWLETGNPVLSNLRITALPNYLLKPKWGEFVLADDEDFKHCDPVVNDQGIQEVEKYTDEKGVEKTWKKMRLRLFRKLDALRARHPGKHVLVLIDEAHNFYPARGWKDNPQAIYSFLTQHRHLNVSVLAVTQNHAMVENTFCRLAQEFRHHKNLVKDSMLELVLWWFGDNFHLAYSCANTGGKPYTREKYGRTWFRIRKDKAAVYSTTQMHASDFRGAARKVKGRSLRLVALFLFLGFIFGSFKVIFMMFGKADEGTLDVEVQAAPSPGRETAVLESIMSIGGRLVYIVQDTDLGRIELSEAYSDERFWELNEKIGKQIEVPGVEQLPLAEVVKISQRKKTVEGKKDESK